MGGETEDSETQDADWVKLWVEATGVVMWNTVMGGVEQALNKLPSDVAAALANRQTANLAREELTKMRLKRAVVHFDYFLNGTGNVQKFSDSSGNQYTGVLVYINDLVRSDTGVRDRLLKGDGVNPGLLKRLANPAYVGKGKIAVSQQDYGVKDWQYSLGGIIVDYEITRKGVPPGGPRRVLLSFRNTYQWHPDNTQLWDQALHKAFNDLVGRHEVTLQTDADGYVEYSNGKVVVICQPHPVANYEMISPPWNTGEDNVKGWPQGKY
jgi:hypothetical protein